MFRELIRVKFHVPLWLIWLLIAALGYAGGWVYQRNLNNQAHIEAMEDLIHAMKSLDAVKEDLSRTQQRASYLKGQDDLEKEIRERLLPRDQ